jgi:hypothetical protein
MGKREGRAPGEKPSPLVSAGDLLVIFAYGANNLEEVVSVVWKCRSRFRASTLARRVLPLIKLIRVIHRLPLPSSILRVSFIVRVRKSKRWGGYNNHHRRHKCCYRENQN